MQKIDHNYIIFLIAIVALANYFWRFLGVYLSGYIKPNSVYARYVRLLAIAITAAMVIKMVFTPQGILEKIPRWNIMSALIVSILAFYLGKKNILVAIIVAIIFFYVIVNFST